MHSRDTIRALERIVIGAVGLTTRSLAQAAPGTELTFPQWRAILILGEGPDGARVGEVAAREGVTLPATGRLLRRLERRGFVTLSTDETDRRATRARLTDRGREVRKAIMAYRRAALRRIAKRTNGDGPARGSVDGALDGAFAGVAAAELMALADAELLALADAFEAYA
jgi:DNA-binding MarR family transcriptional regulator